MTITGQGISMRAVVTGGAGFIGSHLCTRLLRDGNSVLCIDNFLTGQEANITPLRANAQFSFLNHDVSEPISVEGPVDLIFHLASAASPIHYQKYPIQTLKVGSLGTHHALGLAKSKKSAFFLASTSEVYGDPLVNPQPESYWGNVNPVGPRGVYDEAKRFAEAMTMAYHRVHGVNTHIARIFNTFGPRMQEEDGRVVPAFITQALTNKPLTVFGDGSQTRSFCYVDDLVEGILRLVKSDAHDPVNLGVPSEMTVLQIAQKIIQLTGSKSVIEYRTLPVDDPKVRRPDITRARQLLGWEPTHPLDDSLRATIAYFKSRLSR